ncbi:MAG: hypothetical protein IKW90_04115 [Lachnospiraceae bacterium]|nr:hypothetical protein [Lachnospiraceae bacterium]
MKTSMKASKVIVFLVLMTVLNLAFGTTSAKADTSYIKLLNPTGVYDLTIEPGEVRHYVIPIKASGALAQINSLSADSSNSFIKVSNVKLTDLKHGEYADDFDENAIVTIDSMGGDYNLEFDVAASDGLRIGYNTITIYGNVFIRNNNEFTYNQSMIQLTTYTSKELKPIEIVVDKAIYEEEDVFPGKSFTMKLKLKNVGERAAINTFLSMSFGASGIVPDYKVDQIDVGLIEAGATKTIDVPVKVLKTSEPGFYGINANISCKDKEGTENTFTQTMYITVNKANEEQVKTESPVISLSTTDNYIILQPDSEDTLNVIVKNEGKADAYDVKLSVVSGLDTSIGLTKAFTTDSIAVGNIKAGESKEVEVPIRVAKSFGSGLYEIQMAAAYKDEKENEKTSSNMTMYVKGANTIDPEKKTAVSIGNVSQSPENPKAGEKVTVSFDIINDGTTDITNVKVAGTGLSSSSFEPVSSEPYKKVGTIKAGSKSRVSMTFKVGKDISEGFNTLNVTCEYTDESGLTSTESAGLYVLNIINEKKETNDDQKNSRPKLIITQYSAEPIVEDYELEEAEDPDKLMRELKAGRLFTFKYTLKNTHPTKTAKNIKITLEQAEGVFSPTQGSNIFYVDQIPAGETAEQEVILKTRSDVATGDYPVSVKVEYEYDDMSVVDIEHGGVTDENTIKLHAVENYRPEIENIYIEAYDGCYVGQPVDLSFEFYNMGKSTLGNVYVTIEGDFELANNSSKTYVGAVAGYGQEYVNPQIVPLVAGEAYGTVVVHFEDSNGDEQIKTAEFSTYVMGGDDFGDYGDFGDIDWGNMSGNFYNPDFGDYGEYNPDDMGENGEEGTKILGLPLWLFIVICASVAVIIVVIIIVVVVKKKHKRQLEEDDE